MDKNDIPINVFLDLSKAFDTIDHNILQNKLAYYGLNGSALQLFISYLQNRKQFTEIEQINSDSLPITIGVPQGSVLGPLLFIIYINDFSQASQLFNFVMYANDTTLSTSLNSLSETTLDNKSIETIINKEPCNINEWLNSNKLLLSKSKTKYMVLHMPNKRIPAHTLKIDDVYIDRVDEFNFLGFTLDTNLNWRKHTENISNKCSKTIGVLNRLKYVLPLDIKVLLYNTLILSHINYCIMIWGYQRKRNTSIQKNVMRIITLNTYNSHTEPLFKNLKLLKIKDMLKLQELKCYFIYIHKQLPSYLLNWQIIPSINIHNYNIRAKDNIHSFRAKHEFAMKCLRHSLPNTINATPDAIKYKTYTHSLHGFIIYL